MLTDSDIAIAAKQPETLEGDLQDAVQGAQTEARPQIGTAGFGAMHKPKTPAIGQKAVQTAPGYQELSIIAQEVQKSQQQHHAELDNAPAIKAWVNALTEKHIKSNPSVGGPHWVGVRVGCFVCGYISSTSCEDTTWKYLNKKKYILRSRSRHTPEL